MNSKLYNIEYANTSKCFIIRCNKKKNPKKQLIFSDFALYGEIPEKCIIYDAVIYEIRQYFWWNR